MPWKNTWSIEQLKSGVKVATSFRELLPLLNLKYSGSNSVRIKARCIELGIDFSHFREKKVPNRKKPIEELLNSKYSSSANLKKRLIAEGLLERKCYGCGLEHWLSKPIPLELHHKNGNREENQLDNLTLLCPNCHAFTDTYRGKNTTRAGKNKCSEGSYKPFPPD